MSVIISVRNPGKLLVKCLNNLLGLDYPKNRYEIIIVDDFSKVDIRKNLETYIKRSNSSFPHFPEVQVFRRNAHQGYYACANYGIRKAKGEIIVFFAHDLFADKLFLREIVKKLCSKEEVYGVYCKVVTDFERLIPPLYFAPVGAYPLAYRRSTFNEVGFLDERFKSRGDSDFEYRVLKSGLKIENCFSAIVFHPLRKLTLKTLIDYAKRRQYDNLLYAKHPILSKKVLGGLLTGPFIGSLSLIGLMTIFSIIAITMSIFHNGLSFLLLMTLTSLYIIGFLSIVCFLGKIFPTRIITLQDRFEYAFWTPLFLFAITLGRLYGILRFRSLLL